MPPFSVSSGSAAVKLSQSVHLPSSPSDDAGADSLLEALLDSGATALEDSAVSLEATVALEVTALEAASLDVADFAELSADEDGTSLEQDVSETLLDEFPAEDCTVSEEVCGASSAFASVESSPQATNAATVSAHKKTRD